MVVLIEFDQDIQAPKERLRSADQHPAGVLGWNFLAP
jgi:hypothetical protein